MALTDPADLPDVDPALNVPNNSLDGAEWAARFAEADQLGEGLDMDGIAAWFAAALVTGQQNPHGEVTQD